MPEGTRSKRTGWVPTEAIEATEEKRVPAYVVPEWIDVAAPTEAPRPSGLHSRSGAYAPASTQDEDYENRSRSTCETS